MLIIISILFLGVQSLIIDPINQTCVKDSHFTLNISTQHNINMHYFHLPPFSQSTLELDLRHFTSIPSTANNQSCFQFKSIIIREQQGSNPIYETFPNIQANVNKFIIYVDRYTQLGLYFEILDGFEAYKYMLLDSVSIRVIQQNYRIPDQTSSFLFVITNLDAISLPVNRPNVEQYSGYYISKISSNLNSSQTTTISSNSYWTTFNSIATPFIPYLSNCFGEGDKIFLSQLMENQTDCSLVSINETVPIDQFKFGSSPKADICHSTRQCAYNEKPGINMQFPYWFNLPQGSTVFSITKNKIIHSQYQINKAFDDNQLVKCVINQSKGTNSSDQYPLNVKITLQYYQVTQQIKTMITCTVSFSLYLESSADFQYQFQLETKPLNHTYIMLSFGFEWYVYMIVFIIIGFISNVENLVLWLFHWCVSKKQKKQFRIRIYLRVIFQIVKGTFFALIFSIALAFSITIIMNGKIFDLVLYSSELDSRTPKVFWDYLNSQYISDYSSNLALKYRSGRMGLSFFVVGSVLLFYTSKFFIGCEKKAKEYNDYQIMGRLLKPRQWNRGKFIFGTYVYICIQFFFIYFAYSTVYSQNIWTFIVLVKIIQIIMEEITLQIYEDLLPCLPLKVITQITAYMNTLSADNLYDFLFSFLIDVAITMIQKAYVPQLQNIITEKIRQKIAEIVKFYAHLTNDADGQINEAVIQQKQEQEEENQFVLMNSQTEQVKFFSNEEIQLYKQDSQIDLNISQQVEELQKKLEYKLLNYRRHQSKQNSESFYKNNQQQEQQQIIEKSQQEIMEQASLLFQILLDNVLLLFTFLLQPFVILVYWMTYDESGVLANYGISYGVVILYLLSAVVVAIFTIMNMIMIFHLLQSYLEVDFDQKIGELLSRFFNRKLFWKSNDQDINKQIQISFRGADHYCLSWQFFFILAIYITSMVLVMLGISTMINAQYNPFRDAAISLIIFFWFTFTLSSIWLIQKLGYKLNIDGWRNFDGDSLNGNAVLDPDVNLKEGQVQKKSNAEQNTNHGLIFSDFSQNELIGNSMILTRPRKQLIYKQKREEKQINGQSVDDNGEIQQGSQLSEEAIRTKVGTICKKLEQKFEDHKFNMEYFLKNKSFLKKNVERILPLMTELPELNEYRKPSNSIPSQLNGTGKRENKNYDRSVMEIMSKWRIKTDLLVQERQRHGIDFQKQLNSCSFCFQSWGIYYGAGGAICLSCSRQLEKMKKNI